jgi:hypothetical protein
MDGHGDRAREGLTRDAVALFVNSGAPGRSVRADSMVNQMGIFFINNVTVIRLPRWRALTAC